MADSVEDETTNDLSDWDGPVDSRDSTVVLAVADERTRASLLDWFEDEGHDVRVVDPGTVPDDGDVFVLDQGALRTTAPALEEQKVASETFVPCLLVVSGMHADAVASSTDPVLDVVDDVLETPLRTPELRRRVESLLRARTASTRLHEQRAHHERLVDILPAGLFVLDPEGTVTYANAAAADLVRASQTDLVGVDLLEYVHPEDRDAVATHVAAGRSTTRLQARILPEDRDARGDVGFDGDEDAPLVVEISVADVAVDDATQVLVQDVTEREQRVERLRLFERAIAESSIGISVADARAEDEPLVFVNDRFCELTGYDREEVIGRNCRFLQGEATDPEPVAAIREAIRTTSAVSVTLRNYRKDGTPFWNNLEITPVEDDTGTVTHFLGFQRDVTERRERMRLFEHLHEATEELQRAQTKVAVAEAAVSSVQDILDLEVAGCWFPNEDDTALDPVATVGMGPGHPLEPGTPDWDAYVEQSSAVEIPIENHDTNAETGLLFSLGEHGLLGVADHQPYSSALRDAGRVFADHVMVALERAAREEAHANTTAELENTLERINDGFIALDADSRITFVNREAETLLSYTVEDLEGENLWDVFPEEVGAPLWEQYHEALAEQEPRTFETQYDRLDVWFEVTAYPSEDGLTLYFRDVTERRDRKRELERFETIVQTAGDPIYTLDHSGRFTSVNEALLELTGYEREALLGEHAGTVIAEADLPACEHAILELLATDGFGQRTVELTVETADGDRRNCEAAIALLPGEEFGGTVGVVRDLTELKENEQRLAVLDRVLRHNLRNNMNVVAGQASTLTDHADAAVVEVAHEVERAAADVLEMAEKARTFQHALDDAAATVHEADLRAVVSDAIRAIRHDHVDAAIDCELSVDGRVPVRVNDAVELAVHELVENAVVHNPAAEPRVDVTLERHGNDAFVVLADDGPEIPEEETAVLGGGVETPLDHASGLGLWLVQWTASSFGGDLAFERADGGNVVTLRLPTVAGAD